MIIALSGRMHSGKSELAKICESNGFKILKFADGLKNLICKLLYIDRDYLENNKELYKEYIISYEILSYELKIPIEYILAKRKSNIFLSIREIMQFIGTDIIRNYIPDWHIQQLEKNIINGNSYCVDDLRFENEKKFIESISGESWYIMRTDNFLISNHKSETALTWKNFGNNVIINNVTLNLLKKRWSKYIKNITCNDCDILGFLNKKDLRQYLYKKLLVERLSTTDLAKLHRCSRDKIVWWCNNLLVPLSKQKYLYNRDAFLVATSENSYYAGLLASDGCIKKSGCSLSRYIIEFDSIDKLLVESLRNYVCSNKPIYVKYTSGYESKKPLYYVTFEDPYIIENIKYWNLFPNKSCNEQIPDILLQDINNLKQWIVGLIDGDGSVYVSKKTLGITVLSSKTVVDFLYLNIPIKGSVTQHKDTELFELRWFNYKAVDLFNWLSPKRYLNRKWSNIDNFLKFKTVRRTLKYNN